MSEAIKLYLADDHRMIIDGIKAMFSEDETIEIVGEATNPDEMLKEICDLDVDVLVLDIRFDMEDGQKKDGLDVLDILLRKCPMLNVLMLTMFDEPTFARAALRKGAKGYLLKNTGKDEFKLALNVVTSGEIYIHREMAKVIKGNDDDLIKKSRTSIVLSSRELDVLLLICKELKTREIAETLSIQESTVKTHRKSIMSKLGVRNLAGVVKYAIENDLI